MAHDASGTQIKLLDLFAENEVTIKLAEDSRREGDFLLSARNWRGEGPDIQFSEADAYALQDWLKLHLR